MTESGRVPSPYPLDRSFYLRDSLTVAKELLGKLIVRLSEGGPLVCRIVETEAYNEEDPASHSFCGRTSRNAPMYQPGGVAYVYFIYGMYNCFNVVTDREGYGSAVLIRAAEPLSGLHAMWRNRFPGTEPPGMPDTLTHMPEDRRLRCAVVSLANGPGKLAHSLGLNVARHSGMSLLSGELTIQDDGYSPDRVVGDVRIGISVAQEREWRFFIAENGSVSRSRVRPIDREDR
ncbi:MAG TPA: DNA-3-methyladenine glycosylase [Spirochaetia bacterium]|nr:DNA-3-methyladenine glycosylase [Spirochaetia bacterium]